MSAVGIWHTVVLLLAGHIISKLVLMPFPAARFRRAATQQYITFRATSRGREAHFFRYQRYQVHVIPGIPAPVPQQYCSTSPQENRFGTNILIILDQY